MTWPIYRTSYNVGTPILKKFSGQKIRAEKVDFFPDGAYTNDCSDSW